MTALLTQQVFTSLGESRNVKRYYQDGSFDCPYCFYAIVCPKQQCENPWCDTLLNANLLTDRRRKQEEQRREEEQRKRNHELAMLRIEEERKAREEYQQKIQEESRAKLRESALRQVKTILRYRKKNLVAKEQEAYLRLEKWCEKRNINFLNTLQGATKALEGQV